MINESREDHREFRKLLLRLQSTEEQVEAVLRDCRQLQTAALSRITTLKAAGKTKKAEKVAVIYAQLIAREVQLMEDLASNRARVEKIASDIAETDRLEREMEGMG